LEYVVATLRDGCATGRPVVLVIDEFDVFCARTKQTLLYNLLDLTQDPT
jgi:Cdc6-like AAA superfamily ATPase